MQRSKWVLLFLAILGLVLLAACNKKESTEEATTPATGSKPGMAATPIDAATAASISGTVKFDGAAPKTIKIGEKAAEIIAAEHGVRLARFVGERSVSRQ